MPLTYVEHARNFGEHNAVMTGLRHARGAYVITMDDDLQNPPEEVIRLYDHARLGGWDVVYTRYAVKQHAAGATSAAALPTRSPTGCWTSRKALPVLVPLHVGVGRAAVTRYQGPYPYVDGLIMQVTQRIDSIEVATCRASREVQLQSGRLVRLWLNLATSFSLAPLRLAIYAGVVMALLGAAGAVATIVEALYARHTLRLGIHHDRVLLVGGVQSMILGVLGEYVGRTFLSANGKPQGTVRPIERNAAAERRRGVTFYWVTLFAAIATSMAGQTLLKAGAGAAISLPRCWTGARCSACACMAARRCCTSSRCAASRCRAPCPAPPSPMSPPR